ncbi:MAG: LPXTG cell wall anchor domain-containing protein, partial [Lachnospiraceae bacterium]|nr:LPXTG cell wall anchor domain-containing protein [Lachnospiraceae bacterium]
DNPQTNDENNMWMWIAFMGVAALGIAGSAVYDRKRKKD